MLRWSGPDSGPPALRLDGGCGRGRPAPCPPPSRRLPRPGGHEGRLGPGRLQQGRVRRQRGRHAAQGHGLSRWRCGSGSLPRNGRWCVPRRRSAAGGSYCPRQSPITPGTISRGFPGRPSRATTVRRVPRSRRPLQKAGPGRTKCSGVEHRGALGLCKTAPVGREGLWAGLAIPNSRDR